MNRLLFLLPVFFIACGTQLKTANGELQQATEEEQAAIMPAAIMPKEELAAGKQPAGETARIDVDTKKTGRSYTGIV